MSNTNKGPSNPKPKEVVIPLKLKQFRQGASKDAHKAYKASVLAIRSPKAKRTRSKKKGKDPIEIDGQILEYYIYIYTVLCYLKVIYTLTLVARTRLTKS